MNGSDVRSVTYTSIGTKTITVTATTPLETVSRSLTIEVIYPVLQSDITITASPLASDFNSEFEKMITVSGTFVAIAYKKSSLYFQNFFKNKLY